jgi:hypothetical protein
MSRLPVDFKVDPKEWEYFWKWIYNHTGAHHIGPEVSVIIYDPKLQAIRESSMLFFLENKETILFNTPKCSCKGRYIHIYDHLNTCPVKKFNDYAVSFKVSGHEL